MFLPDYVEKYGLANTDYQTSIHAIEQITQFTSCEFAVRPFIIQYPQKMMQQMLVWTTHESEHVRRLASEGCRPRLPWAMALPSLKQEPSPILPILTQLKNDPSEYVRRSVANNLNDITKDNPEIVLQIAQGWKGESPQTDRILKHGCRTLLKQGNTTVLQLFGFGAVDGIALSNFRILTPSVKIGDYLQFSFELTNKAPQPILLRLEYGLYYLKSNGSLSRKVFKISEKQYDGQRTTTILRKQSFRLITTRQFYTGQHQLSIIVNGRELAKESFELTTNNK